MKLPTMPHDLRTEIAHSIMAESLESITFVLNDTTTACPRCISVGYDPLCPTCNGTSEITSELTLSVDANVRYRSLDKYKSLVGSSITEGNCIIKVHYSPEMEENITNVKEIRVGIRTFTISKTELRGFPANRIILYCVQLQNDLL